MSKSLIAAEGATNPIGLPWGEVVIAAIVFRDPGVRAA